MELKEIKGDLIKLAKEGKFDVIAHGCNCQCMMGAGIAVLMRENFNAHKFELEHISHRADINKLGQIDFNTVNRQTGNVIRNWNSFEALYEGLIVVNAYTQFHGGANLDYEALQLCLRKMNAMFKGQRIGLPMIGCGIAGGDWNRVRHMIRQELVDCDVTIVIYNR
ncbi:MAG: hypothetical protein PQJ49_07975 [Sphaerochaetaceae bacterium]|nr:hypothetical protein [Sphaerochaetaceae bacterium]